MLQPIIPPGACSLSHTSSLWTNYNTWWSYGWVEPFLCSKLKIPCGFEQSGIDCLVWKLQQDFLAVEICCVNIDGLVQEWRNPIANALELRLSCTTPLIWNTEQALKREHSEESCAVLWEIEEWFLYFPPALHTILLEFPLFTPKHSECYITKPIMHLDAILTTNCILAGITNIP